TLISCKNKKKAVINCLLTMLCFKFYFIATVKLYSSGGKHCVLSQAMNSTVPLTLDSFPFNFTFCWKTTSFVKYGTFILKTSSYLVFAFTFSTGLPFNV